MLQSWLNAVCVQSPSRAQQLVILSLGPRTDLQCTMLALQWPRTLLIPILGDRAMHCKALAALSSSHLLPTSQAVPLHAYTLHGLIQQPERDWAVACPEAQPCGLRLNTRCNAVSGAGAVAGAGTCLRISLCLTTTSGAWGAVGTCHSG